MGHLCSSCFPASESSCFCWTWLPPEPPEALAWFLPLFLPTGHAFGCSLAGLLKELGSNCHSGWLLLLLRWTLLLWEFDCYSLRLYYLKRKLFEHGNSTLACHTFRFSFCRQLISLTSDFDFTDLIPNIVIMQKGRNTKKLKRAHSVGMWPPRPLFVCFKAACLQGYEGNRWYSLFRVSSPACMVPLAGRIAFLRAVAGYGKKVEHRFLRSHAV